MEHRQAFSSPIRGESAPLSSPSGFSAVFSVVSRCPLLLEVYPRANPSCLRIHPWTRIARSHYPTRLWISEWLVIVIATLKPASKNRQCMQSTDILHHEYHDACFPSFEIQNMRKLWYRLIKSWICWYLFVPRCIFLKIFLTCIDWRVKKFKSHVDPLIRSFVETSFKFE